MIDPRRWNPFVRFPLISLILAIGASIPLILFWTRFEINSETEVLLEGDQRNFSSYQKVRSILKEDVVLLINMRTTNVFTAASIRTLFKIGDAFLDQPGDKGVVDVKSLTHSSKPVRKGLSFDFVPFVNSLDPAELEKVKKFSLEHPLVRNLLVSPDGKNAAITVTYNRDLSTAKAQKVFRKEVRDILQPFKKEGYEFEMISFPLIEEEIRSTLYQDIYNFLPAAAVLLIIILWATFRSLRIFAVILISQAFLISLIPGMVESAGFSLNVFSSMLFPLLSGMHLTLLIHVCSAFQRARHATPNLSAAIHETFRQVFKSCCFSTLATTIGLISLAICDVEQVRNFGLIGAVGMILVFVLTFGPDVALLLLVFRGTGTATSEKIWSTKERHLADASAWLTRLVTKQRRTVLGLTAVGLVLALVGLRLVRTDIRAVEFLGKSSETRRAAEMIDQLYGGINFVQIELQTGQTNGVNRLPFLQYLERVHTFAEKQPGVATVFSYSHFLAMMNQIWEREKPGSLALPSSEFLINLFVTALRSQSFQFTEALADSTFQKAYLVIRTQDMPVDRYLKLIEDVTQFAQKEKPANVTVSAAEGIHSILEADRRIIRGQFQSALITAGVICLVLTLLWRSVWLGALSLATNLLPVLLILSASGYFDWPLNSVTLMLAAIVLGIAMDDSVHFITHWSEARRRGLSNEDAIQETLRQKGMPIVSTSLILIGIFSLFWLSSFPPVVHFGVLAAIAFVIAQLTVITFLPALLSLASKFSRKSIELRPPQG